MFLSVREILTQGLLLQETQTVELGIPCDTQCQSVWPMACESQYEEGPRLQKSILLFWCHKYNRLWCILSEFVPCVFHFCSSLSRKHPGCGNIVTFAQFLFIAVEGFLFEADLGRKPPAIPLRYGTLKTLKVEPGQKVWGTCSSSLGYGRQWCH